MTDTNTTPPVQLPAVDCDTLSGLEQIAAFRGLTEGQARGQIEKGFIPVFRLPGCRTLFASKSAIYARVSELAQPRVAKRA